jgi:hypothetical protein
VENHKINKHVNKKECHCDDVAQTKKKERSYITSSYSTSVTTIYLKVFGDRVQ